MAMVGTLKSRNGKLYVLYTSDEYSEPFRQYLWWRVLETHGTGYGERPEAEDIATSTGGGGWRTRNPSTHRSTGSVSTGTGSTQAETVERVSINPPPAGGKELRWRDGRWEKLMAKGWASAGEGKAKTSKKSSTHHSTAKRHHATKKKSGTQLDREIAEVVPGWAKGLDLSESRALGKRLHVSQAELEAKQRRIESDRRAALPSLSITDAGDGIFVRVSSPGPGYGKYHAAVDALKAFQLPIGNAIPPNIFVPVHKAADKTKARTKVEKALRYAGYRV